MTNAICSVHNYMKKIEMQNLELTKQQYYSGDIKGELVRLLSQCSSKSDREATLQLETIWYKNLRRHILTTDSNIRFLEVKPRTLRWRSRKYYRYRILLWQAVLKSNASIMRCKRKLKTIRYRFQEFQRGLLQRKK